MNERLYRSRDDRVLGGVCAGLAERMDFDPSLVRVLWVVGTVLTGFVFGILLYVVLLIVVPEAPEGWLPGPAGYPPPPMPPRPDAAPGWTPPDAGAAGAATVAFASATGGPPSGGEPTGAGEPAPATSPAGAQDAGWTPPPAAPAGWTPPPGEGGWAPPPGEGGWAPPPGTAGGSAPGGDAWMAADAAYATRRAERRARRRHDERIVGLVFGLLLILVGVWFLLREYLPDIDFDRFWPLIIIGIGVVLLVAAFAGSRGSRDGGATG